MKRKNTDKETHIIKTAMKLFSSKNYNRTSMQEIANICGISKGTLYIYFKSKEDLLLHILKYYFHSIEEQIIALEQDTSLTDKDRFIREIEIKLNHYMENQAFYRLQIQDLPGLSDQNIYQFLRRQNIVQIKRIKNYLIAIYGQEISGFAADGAFILTGMLKQYMELIMLKQLPIPIKKVLPFLVKQMDFIMEGVKHQKVEAIVNKNLWNIYLEDVNQEEVNPLEVIQQMKLKLNKSTFTEAEKEDGIQSLCIMEEELMKLQPRAVILRGMLHNLKNYPFLDELRMKLNNNLPYQKT
ncbi:MULTISPECIES: TetR/AcrR family transcriptional regulator [Virgibacillus]|uniref:DNA-binding transcriptional repressor AcrR n=1 Tax=Virgibacillus massiliensis TaxID=1462526 RepID=A0A024Q9P5_9BACI|nr:TetR/AcrR family transcriptional regulator [Virgibacillus massiliensis]CDQ38925.1 DNA-binding transcriptional repressor AcrR [Virgibacillus massiliensis]